MYGTDPTAPNYYFAGDSSLPLDVLSSAASLVDLVRSRSDELAELLADRVDNHGHLTGSMIEIVGPVYIGKDTVIHAGVSIEGPVYVGPRCSIRHGAQLRAGTVLGEGCVVGHGAELKSSICMAGSKMQSGVFVGNSILGLGARLGGGTIVGNRRFDQRVVRMGSSGVRVDTDLEFVGAVIGDYVRLGANVVTAPGTLIGPHSWIASLISLSGFVPRTQLVTLTQELLYREKGETPLRSGEGEYEHL